MLIAALDLQVVVHSAHAAHLHGQLLGARLLFGRLDHAVERDHTIGRVDIDTGKVRHFVRYELGFHFESSIFCPAVLPVMDVQPVADNSSAKAKQAIMGLRADRFIASSSLVTLVIADGVPWRHSTAAESLASRP